MSVLHALFARFVVLLAAGSVALMASVASEVSRLPNETLGTYAAAAVMTLLVPTTVASAAATALGGRLTSWWRRGLAGLLFGAVSLGLLSRVTALPGSYEWEHGVATGVTVGALCGVAAEGVVWWMRRAPVDVRARRRETAGYAIRRAGVHAPLLYSTYVAVAGVASVASGPFDAEAAETLLFLLALGVAWAVTMSVLFGSATAWLRPLATTAARRVAVGVATSGVFAFLSFPLMMGYDLVSAAALAVPAALVGGAVEIVVARYTSERPTPVWTGWPSEQARLSGV